MGMTATKPEIIELDAKALEELRQRIMAEELISEDHKIFLAALDMNGEYDVTVPSIIALLKYGSGLPFNRLEGLQRNFRTPDLGGIEMAPCRHFSGREVKV
jgi:hypothetical protein